MADNNGSQTITFNYQQEGTSLGFNGLLNNVVANGVISGGTLVKYSSNVVKIKPLEMIISDSAKNATIHLKTTDDAEVVVEQGKPYIVASFTWMNVTQNYVKFEAKASSDFGTDDIILGKCEYTGGTLEDKLDYTCRMWSPIYRNNDFTMNAYNSMYSSLTVTELPSTNDLGFVVNRGKAVINGREVVVNSPISVTLVNSPSSDPYYFNGAVTNKRIDIIVMYESGTVGYIMGIDEASPTMPQAPSNALLLAKVTLEARVSTSRIYGHEITNFNNNNFMSFSPSVGKKVGADIVNPHTLYI